MARQLKPEQLARYREKAKFYARNVKEIGFDIFGEPDGFIGHSVMELCILRKRGDGRLTRKLGEQLIREEFETLYGVRFKDYAAHIIATNPEFLK